MSGRPLIKDRLLFTEGDWGIYSAGRKYKYKYGPKEERIIAYANHKGCNVMGYGDDPTNCWFPGDGKQKCVICSTNVPDTIQTLVVLFQ